MARITVRFYATLREKTGRDEILIESVKNLRDVFYKLKEIYGEELMEALYDPKTDTTRKGVLVFINGLEPQYVGGMNAKLKDGDTIALFPPAGGG